MCKSPLHDFLEALPKVENHVHLEGSLSPELLFELAAKNGISLPEDDPAFTSTEALYRRYEDFSSLEDFLHYYYIGISTLIYQSDYERLAYAYFEKANSQNVKHAEVFFDIQMHVSRGVKLSELLAGLKKAQKRANSDFGITTELIMCFVRHLPVKSAVEMFQVADEAGYFEDGTICGIGMDSTELDKPATSFAPLLELAIERNIRRTIHAGEEGPPVEYVSAALDSGAMRIDHGWRALEDEALLNRIVDTGTPLTICPISNAKLKVVPDIADIPIRNLLKRNVRFSLNSDDPMYYGAFIQENYCAIQAAIGLTVDEWATMTKGAMKSSWASAERITELLGLLDDVVKQWR